MQNTEWWRRICNYVIDLVFIILLNVLIIGIFNILNDTGGFEELFRLLKFLDHIIVIFVVVYFLYYLSMESIFGLTIGKLFTQTRTIDFAGNKPSFWKIILRSLIRLIPIDWFTFFRKNPLGWHDSGSKTKVVRKEKTAAANLQ